MPKGCSSRAERLRRSCDQLQRCSRCPGCKVAALLALLGFAIGLFQALADALSHNFVRPQRHRKCEMSGS